VFLSQVLLSDSSKPKPPVQEAVVAPKQPREVDEAEELQVAHVPRAGSRGRHSEDSKVKRVQEPREAKQAIEETDETHAPINVWFTFWRLKHSPFYANNHLYGQPSKLGLENSRGAIDIAVTLVF
jgi:hypothetical protein